MAHPIANAIRMRLVYLRDSYIDIETVVHLFIKGNGLEDDTYRQDVINLIERNVFRLHLVPNGIYRLDTSHDSVFQPHLIKLLAYRGGKLCKHFITFGSCFLKFNLYVPVFFRMLVFEAKVLQLSLDFVQSQTIGEGSVKVQCFSCNLILLVGSLRLQSAHIVQTVCNLNEDDAYIIVHCEQQLFEVLCLSGGVLTEDTT